ncbi:MAG: hypothetical protein KC478_04615, partial [Bacteriovoracaceae bacterium]|nr:hypothetical protein [Bacteriovoracaceae bacterium]
MSNKTEQNNSLQFQNVEKLNQSVYPHNEIESSEEELPSSFPTWECYLRYFFEYKKLIIISAITIPMIVFTLFQNKFYKANVGFKIEPGQDLTSNILSDSLMGIRSNKNSLANIPQRALSKAQSTSFYQELAQVVLSNPDYLHTRYKLVEE